MCLLAEPGARLTPFDSLWEDPYNDPFTGIGRYQGVASWSGGVAQLGERYVRNVQVRGSSPLTSTKGHLEAFSKWPLSLDLRIKYNVSNDLRITVRVRQRVR